MKSKRSKILLVVVFLLTAALGGTAIFIGYRLSQEEEITPEEPEAAGGWGRCCDPEFGCTGGKECVMEDCEQWLDPIDGLLQPCGDGTCHSWHKCENDQCHAIGWRCRDCPDCEVCGEGCVEWFNNNKTNCEWPKVLFTGRPSGSSVDVCRCGICGGSQDPLNACSENPPGTNDKCCDLGSCPSGYISCGNSTDDPNTFSSDCLRYDGSGGTENISCTVFHEDCNNPSVIYKYCKPEEQPGLQCGDNCEDLDDEDCEGSLVCERPGADRICVGPDFQECDLQEHLANDCSCPAAQTLTCENLTLDGAKSKTITPGESYTGTLEVLSGGSATATREYTFGRDSGYGTVDPAQASGGMTKNSTWSITSAQTEAMSAGTHSDVIYVTVNAGDLSDGGKGDVNCSLDLVVEEEDCNCELIERVSKDDTIAPGALIPYVMTAGCEVAANEVEWSTDPTMEVDPGSRVPTGDQEAIQHHIVFKVPEDAQEDDTYSVSALITGQSQVEECQDTFTISGEEEPAYVAIKSSQVECINNNTAARITYTIHVRNVSDQDGTIEYIEDTYDSRFDRDWVANINPTPDSHSGNVIRWDNDDAGYTLSPNDGSEGGEDEVEFTYEVTVPASAWGDYVGDSVDLYTFRNNAIVKPEEQDPIELQTAVKIVCLGTGIFDEAITSVLMGLFLIVAGAVVFRFREYTYKYLSPVEKVSSYAGLAVKNTYSKSIGKLRTKFGKAFDRFKDKFRLSRKERFEKDLVEKIDKEDE